VHVRLHCSARNDLGLGSEGFVFEFARSARFYAHACTLYPNPDSPESQWSELLYTSRIKCSRQPSETGAWQKARAPFVQSSPTLLIGLCMSNSWIPPSLEKAPCSCPVDINEVLRIVSKDRQELLFPGRF
jgi:hypothetical protein